MSVLHIGGRRPGNVAQMSRRVSTPGADDQSRAASGQWMSMP